MREALQQAVVAVRRRRGDVLTPRDFNSPEKLLLCRDETEPMRPIALA